jgi:selenocysteine lyase/cysteine desulfurase
LSVSLHARQYGKNRSYRRSQHNTRTDAYFSSLHATTKHHALSLDIEDVFDADAKHVSLLPNATPLSRY